MERYSVVAWMTPSGNERSRLWHKGSPAGLMNSVWIPATTRSEASLNRRR